MIARRLERPVDAAENALALMRDLRELAVHRGWRAHDLPAERLADRLQPKADAEHRDLRRGCFDKVEADAGLVGRAGTGREHDRVGVGVDHLTRGHLVIAMHDDISPQLAKIM